jgi:hypothetical protein
MAKICPETVLSKEKSWQMRARNVASETLGETTAEEVIKANETDRQSKSIYKGKIFAYKKHTKPQRWLRECQTRPTWGRSAITAPASACP